MNLTQLFAGGTDVWIATFLTVGIAYLCGCFNGAVIVSKYILRNDVRNHGSGNAGLTNFYRTFGGPLTLVVILTDMIKAVVAIELGVMLATVMIANDSNVILLAHFWAGFWCLMGHAYPFMFGFRGGKGILSGGTVAIMIDWRVALLVWGGFIFLTIVTKYVSVGSIYAGLFFTVGTWLFLIDNFAYQWPILMLAIAFSGLIIWKHRENLVRLIQGKENKFSFGRKRTTEDET